MHYFEDRLAAVGRSIDRVIDRLRERSPRRYRAARTGPTMRERVRESRERLAERLSFTHRRRWRDLEPEERRRAWVGVAAAVALLACAAAWWMIRTHTRAPTLEELMDQAMVRARLEVGQEGAGGGAFMGWGK